MFGKAAIIAVLLAPTASIARHDDHRTATDPVCWFNVVTPSARCFPANLLALADEEIK
jgi:hypothetical protein